MVMLHVLVFFSALGGSNYLVNNRILLRLNVAEPSAHHALYNAQLSV